MAKGSLYAPVVRNRQGELEVVLGAGHPGFHDPEYRRRRNELAALSIDWKAGDPIPEARYTVREHDVWRIIALELDPLHHVHACRAFLESKEALRLPTDHVPQLSEVSRLLSPLTGFEYHPVAGLAPLREFYGSFAGSVFFSTQYLRHPSQPLYTPEPDIVHEVVGHAHQLACPELADVYRLVGEAVARTESDAGLQLLSRVFWFTLEFGLVEEGGEPKAYGAGILSSCGETASFLTADIRPLDVAEMAAVPYDITRYQPVLFLARSMAHLIDTLSDFFSTFDDDTRHLLTRELA